MAYGFHDLMYHACRPYYRHIFWTSSLVPFISRYWGAVFLAKMTWLSRADGRRYVIRPCGDAIIRFMMTELHCHDFRCQCSWWWDNICDLRDESWEIVVLRTQGRGWRCSLLSLVIKLYPTPDLMNREAYARASPPPLISVISNLSHTIHMSRSSMNQDTYSWNSVLFIRVWHPFHERKSSFLRA